MHDPHMLPIVTSEAINVTPNTEANISLDMTYIAREEHPYKTNCTRSWSRSSLKNFINVSQYENEKSADL